MKFPYYIVASLVATTVAQQTRATSITKPIFTTDTTVEVVVTTYSSISGDVMIYFPAVIADQTTVTASGLIFSSQLPPSSQISSSPTTTVETAVPTTASPGVEQHDKNQAMAIGFGVSTGILLIIVILGFFTLMKIRRRLINWDHDRDDHDHYKLPTDGQIELPAKDVVRQSLVSLQVTDPPGRRGPMWELMPEPRHESKKGIKSVFSKLMPRS